MKPRVWAISGLFIASSLLFGCRPESGAPRSQQTGYESAYRGLCRSRALAAEDFSRARDAFYAEAHTELHRLADETAGKDRALAAQLLEAKNRTEADLGGASPQAAAASLEELLRVSRQALISLGAPPKPCDN